MDNPIIFSFPNLNQKHLFVQKRAYSFQKLLMGYHYSTRRPPRSGFLLSFKLLWSYLVEQLKYSIPVVPICWSRTCNHILCDGGADEAPDSSSILIRFGRTTNSDTLKLGPRRYSINCPCGPYILLHL